MVAEKGDIWAWDNLIDSEGVTVIASPGGDGQLIAANTRDPRIGRIFRSQELPTEGEAADLAGLEGSFGGYNLVLGPNNLVLATENLILTPGTAPPGVYGSLRFQLPTAGPIAVVGLFGVNLSEVSWIIIRVGTAPGLGDLWAESIDPTQYDNGQVVVVHRNGDGEVEPVSSVHLTIEWTGPIPFELGRVWAGPASWEPQANHTLGDSGWQTFDFSTRVATPRSGAFLIDRAARKRTFTANYDALYPEEYGEAIYRMDAEVGLSAQVLFIPAPDVYPIKKWPILGYLRELEETRFVGFLRAQRSLSIVECG